VEVEGVEGVLKWLDGPKAGMGIRRQKKDGHGGVEEGVELKLKKQKRRKRGKKKPMPAEVGTTKGKGGRRVVDPVDDPWFQEFACELQRAREAHEARIGRLY